MALSLLYSEYHVTIVAIGNWLLKKFWPTGNKTAFYALQGVPLFETMQASLLH